MEKVGEIRYDHLATWQLGNWAMWKLLSVELSKGQLSNSKTVLNPQACTMVVA